MSPEEDPDGDKAKATRVTATKATVKAKEAKEAKEDEERRGPQGSRHRRPPGLQEMDVFARNPTGAGITFGASIVLFTLAGYALDGWLETLPLFLLIGLAVGGIGGFIHLVETVSPGTLFKSRRRKR